MRQLKRALIASIILCCFALSFISATCAEEGTLLHLRSNVFDPLQKASAAAEPEAKGTKTCLWLVQFSKKPSTKMLEELAAAKAKVLGYIPDNAYLVYSTKPIPRLSNMRWSGPFKPDYKLEPNLKQVLTGPTALSDSSTSVNLVVQIPKGSQGSEERVTGEIETMRGKLRAKEAVADFVNLRVSVPLNQIMNLASNPEVIWIEPEPERRLLGERADQIAAGEFDPTQSCANGPGYRQWLTKHGLGGAGFVCHVADDGLDQGIATNEPGTAHPDILGRIVGIDNLTDDPLGDGKAGHGQINAGIIMGNATVGTTHLGYLLGLGMAPEGSIYASKVFNNAGEWADGISINGLVKPARQAGSLVSSNSWGARTGGGYNTDCQLYDSLARDADPDAQGNQGMTFVFASGNEGQTGLFSINAPASAKNAIAAGASENCDADGIDECGHSSTSADNIGQLTAFTSRGPTSDGRIGVTLVAPGTHVQGPDSTSTDYTGASVCGYWPDGQTDYVRSSGTSHSTPVIAGAALLVHEWYFENKGVLPSPAMVRAALINGAYDMQGGIDSVDGSSIQPIPNPHQGWGRLSMENVFSPETPRFHYDQETVLTGNTPEYNVTIAASDSSTPLKITLVWTDAPSSPASSKHLRNDLDLIVEQNGVQWFGNVFANGVSITGGTADRVDTIECVYIPTPAGSYNVKVRAYDINSDGVPGNAFPMDQDFALVVSNGTDQSSAGTVLFDKAYYPCSGTVTVTVSDTDLRGAGTASVEVSSLDLGDLETVNLLENEANSGILSGTISLQFGTASAGDDMLQVQDLTEIMAQYHDLDNGEGQVVDVTKTALIDCQFPVISNVKIDRVNMDSAVVSWETDEKADSLIRYGTDSNNLNLTASFPVSATEHKLTLSNLDSCTVYCVQIESKDIAGNRTIDNNSGLCYKFATKQVVDIFEDTLEPDAKPGWTHTAAVGTDGWQVVQFEQAHSGTHAWFCPSTETLLDDYLFTPPFDVQEGTYFSFWHTYELESTFDGAVLEISQDGGTTWEDLSAHFVKGSYDSIISNEWDSEIGDRNAWTGGSIGAMTEVSVDLSAFAGPTRMIRFRLACDDGNTDVGWYVDDVSIYRTKTCLSEDGDIAWSQNTYNCASIPTITLSDTDLAGSGSQILSVTSTTEPGGENFILYETSTAGVFIGSVTLFMSPAGADGVLNVSDGDELGVIYIDAQTLSGKQNVDHFRSADLDCAAPQVQAVSTQSITHTGATVTWETDEPSKAILRYGPAGDQLDFEVRSDFFKTAHSATITGLSSCSRIYYDIVVEDEAGNKNTDNNNGEFYTLRTYQVGLVFQDLLDGQANAGWTHAAGSGTDDWALTNYAQANSGTQAWFTSNPSTTKDCWLITPPLDIAADSVLSFWHTFEFEQYGYDGAVLEISTTGGQSWTDLGTFATQNGYSGSFPIGNPLGNRSAWIYGTLGTMRNVLVDLSLFEGADRLIRFRFASDSSVGAVGWYIDDVEVYSYLPCGEEDTPTETPTTTETPTATETPTPRNTPTVEELDFNGDGSVDKADLLLLLKQWHTTD